MFMQDSLNSVIPLSSEVSIVISNTMAPNELFGDSILGHFAQFSQEWSLFEVDIHAVSKTYFILAN